MPPQKETTKKKSLRNAVLGIATVILIISACFYGAGLFLDISWLASLGSSRNVGVILFRAGLVPLFALIFAVLAVVHSWLGSSRERHNKNFLIFKFLFFFVTVCTAESFLRISETLIYALMAGSTGIKDSLFFIDMSWYLFWIPLIKNISLFLTGYFAVLFVFRFSYPGDHKKIAYGKISICLFSLFSIVFLLIVYGQYLSERRTASSDPFLGYSDLFGHLIPLAASLLWTWLFLALSIYFFRRRYRILFAGGVLTFLVLVGCNLIWPFYLDKFIFAPNKTFYQNKFAGIHAENTRRAFGLTALSKDSAFIPDTASNLPTSFLLDENIFLKQIQGTQDFHNSFTFTRADSILLDGQPYMISARVLNTLSSEWELLHFRDIYGYGAAIASAARTDENGGPVYALEGLELKGAFPLDNPEIFFAENFNTYAFINTKMPIPSYENTTSALAEKTFTGVESISFGFLHKLALAFHEKDLRPLFTKYYTPKTKLLYYRKPSELAKKILPYFEYTDPRLLYYNKALWWEMDGYVSSQDVFVAASVDTPWGKKNWLRAPIRAYVNAYSGEVFFRRVNPDDPMVRVISRTFPKLFTKTINPDVVSYPELLFRIQSRLLERYHETNAGAFYNGLSARALTTGNGPEPSVLHISNTRVFGLAQNYSTVGKKLFAARFTAYVDTNGRSSLHLYEAPQSSVDGDQALTALKASEEYQNMLAYWRSIETAPVLGRMTGHPYKDGIFYIQTIYTNAAGLDMPVLAKAAVINNNTVRIAGVLGELPALIGAEETNALPLTRQQQLERSLRDAYLYYLDAEKARIQGKPQDYQKNVEKIGEELRRAGT